MVRSGSKEAWHNALVVCVVSTDLVESHSHCSSARTATSEGLPWEEKFSYRLTLLSPRPRKYPQRLTIHPEALHVTNPTPQREDPDNQPSEMAGNLKDEKFPLCGQRTLNGLARGLEAEADVLVVTKTSLAGRLLLRGRGKAAKI